MGREKCAKMFKKLLLKRLHTFGNRLEIGTTIIPELISSLSVLISSLPN